MSGNYDGERKGVMIEEVIWLSGVLEKLWNRNDLS